MAASWGARKMTPAAKHGRFVAQIAASAAKSGLNLNAMEVSEIANSQLTKTLPVNEQKVFYCATSSGRTFTVLCDLNGIINVIEGYHQK